MSVLGKGYIIQHCVAFIRNKAHSKAYREYVTDALKVIAENTAQQCGGKTLTMRFADMISNEKPDERTEEDIINGLKAKLRKNK